MFWLLVCLRLVYVRPIYLSIYLSIYLPIYLPVCLSSWLAVLAC